MSGEGVNVGRLFTPYFAFRSGQLAALAQRYGVPAITQSQDVHAWLVESSEIAKASAYKSPIGPSAGPFTLTDAYKRQAKKIANERVAIAGARLGKLLNDALQ